MDTERQERDFAENLLQAVRSGNDFNGTLKSLKEFRSALLSPTTYRWLLQELMADLIANQMTGLDATKQLEASLKKALEQPKEDTQASVQV